MSGDMFVTPVVPKRNPDGSGTVVVLDLIEPGSSPAYCIHGRVTCYWCEEWCWLGDQTHTLVVSGAAAPICLPCATRLLPKGSKPLKHVEDWAP